MPQKLEKLIELSRLLRNGLAAVIVSCLATTISAQEVGNSDWEGEWLAEGTLFRIGVSIEAGILKVTQIESMGQVWSNEDGEIDGNIARVQVDYAGATGIIQAELIDANTAVLFAASCQPDFMVVCVLSKDRQALFTKVSSPAPAAVNSNPNGLSTDN